MTGQRGRTSVGTELAENVRVQIDALDLDSSKPLVISDADEVLLQFVAGLERYLERRGLWLDLQSFALTGNIKHKSTGEPVPADDVPGLLKEFYATDTHTLEPVPDAAASLSVLAARAQIVVLTNIPAEQRTIRAESLAAHGMDYPVVANAGLKGAAVAELARRSGAPVFFLDDIPHNIASVARAHGASHRIHFIADDRLARLLGPAEDSHFHATRWPAARAFIEDRLSEHGF